MTGAIEVPRHVAIVIPHGDDHRPLRWDQQGDAIQRVLQQGPRVQQRGVLLGALVPVQTGHERPQPDTLAAGQHDLRIACHDLLGGQRHARWQGVELDGMEPEAVEVVLADTVLKEFKVRLGRIGIEYQTPVRP